MYDEWGNPQVGTDFNINKSGVSNLNNYTDYTYDDVLGIYYAQNRFYDAGIKRFVQEDPIKDGMNWYAYVGNNPINKIDPTGLVDIDPSESAGEMPAATIGNPSPTVEVSKPVSEEITAMDSQLRGTIYTVNGQFLGLSNEQYVAIQDIIDMLQYGSPSITAQFSASALRNSLSGDFYNSSEFVSLTVLEKSLANLGIRHFGEIIEFAPNNKTATADGIAHADRILTNIYQNRRYSRYGIGEEIPFSSIDMYQISHDEYLEYAQKLYCESIRQKGPIDFIIDNAGELIDGVAIYLPYFLAAATQGAINLPPIDDIPFGDIQDRIEYELQKDEQEKLTFLRKRYYAMSVLDEFKFYLGDDSAQSSFNRYANEMRGGIYGMNHLLSAVSKEYLRAYQNRMLFVATTNTSEYKDLILALEIPNNFEFPKVTK